MLNLKLVVLECAVDVWNEPITGNTLHKIQGLKLDGYGSEYRRGVLPIDTSDYVATHLALCEEVQGRLDPVIAYRSVTLSQCRTFELQFPPLAIAQAAGAEGHVAALEALIQAHDRADLDLRYCSSYTIRPDIRADRAKTGALKEMLAALGYHVNQSSKRADGQREGSLLCGVTRFKVDQMFESWGYQGLTLNGEPLPCIRQTSLKGEEVKMLSLAGDWSLYAHGAGRKYKQLWDGRLILNSQTLRKAA